MVTCIAGMHRSGTSMVARLLRDCGLYLGPDAELSRSSRHNTDGYWENLSFVRFNDDLIGALGGTWDAPPHLVTAWEAAPELDPFLERAERLLENFGQENWGWKDPRNSLTFPFWKRLVPDLRVIVCLRNPLEVERSLFLRDESNSHCPFELWAAYYDQLLRSTRPSQRLVTHYDSFFESPDAELRRVLNWLDLEVEEKTIAETCARVSDDLRHYHVSLADLVSADISEDLLRLYFGLCAEAGPVYQAARRAEAQRLPRHSANGDEKEIAALRSEIDYLKALHHEILDSKAFKIASFFWRRK